MLSFSQAIRLIRADVVEHPRKAVKVLSYRVVEGSAIDTSSFANSWTPNIGEMKADNVDVTGGNISPVLGRISAVCQHIEPGNVYTMGNGQPYGPRLEFEAHSPQTPNGTLRIAAAEWRQINREVAGGR